MDLPFPYYQRDEDDVFFFLYQNSYAVFNIEEDRNKVIVKGPLQPCIAIVLSDGYKPLNNEKVCDGIYRHAQHNISIKMNNLLSDEQEKNINIFSISLVAENVLDFATETVNSQFLFGEEIPSFPIPVLGGNSPKIMIFEPMLL